MSEIEPQKHSSKSSRPGTSQEVVPVPIAEVREFVREAVHGTILTNPIGGALAGFALFQPHLRFTAVDDAHSRIEIDVVGMSPKAEKLFYMQKRAMIHRFFVALDDELDRRERWRPNLPVPRTPIESGESTD